MLYTHKYVHAKQLILCQLCSCKTAYFVFVSIIPFWLQGSYRVLLAAILSQHHLTQELLQLSPKCKLMSLHHATWQTRQFLLPVWRASIVSSYGLQLSVFHSYTNLPNSSHFAGNTAPTYWHKSLVWGSPNFWKSADEWIKYLVNNQWIKLSWRIYSEWYTLKEHCALTHTFWRQCLACSCNEDLVCIECFFSVTSTVICICAGTRSHYTVLMSMYTYLYFVQQYLTGHLHYRRCISYMSLCQYRYSMYDPIYLIGTIESIVLCK